MLPHPIKQIKGRFHTSFLTIPLHNCCIHPHIREQGTRLHLPEHPLYLPGSIFPRSVILRSIHSTPKLNPGPKKWMLLSRARGLLSPPDQFLARVIVSGLLLDLDLPFWNSLLHSLSPKLTFSLFNLLCRHGLVPDSYTLTSVLKAIAHLSLPNRGEQLHSLALKLGLQFDTFVLNSLIHMYAASGLVGIARKLFDSAPASALDVVSWNTLISGYVQSNLCEQALGLFARMAERPVAMDAITPVSALIACGRIGALDHGRRIHTLVVVNGFDLNFYLGSSLVSMYAKSGAIQDARKLFDYMPDRNAVCWTSMISGYAHSGRFRESIELFRAMQVAGVKPDDATIASVVSSCAQLGALDQGRYVHAYCDIYGLGLDISVKNALIDMYLKCGDIERALQIFRGLAQPDVFSWTVIISGLAMNGYSNEALDLFSQMEVKGNIIPNEVTFLGLLSACSHGGFVKKGYHYFDCMATIYKLKPRIEHYGCMVDLLGRAKLLVEALRFIKEMPIEPDVVIWRSLLFACRANGDVKLAEYIAERIIELEPRKCGGHVLLSNIYAVASRWSDVNRVRRFMNDSSIQKKPGCSFIEGHEAFVSYEGLEQLHRFIFVMAITHVSYSCLTMLLAIVKIHTWRKWEEEAHRDPYNSYAGIQDRNHAPFAVIASRE